MLTPDSRISIVLCLGNPGIRYSMTLHNAGFWVADILAREAGVAFRRAGAFDVAYLPGGVHLVKPTTYMNESGRAAGAVLTARQKDPSQMLVVSDDVNLPLGKLRLRTGGSAGGHNGLKDIIRVLGTDGFPRLRLGVGPKPDNTDLAVFVLKKLPQSLHNKASVMANRAADCVLDTINKGIEYSQSVYNRSTE